MTLWNSPDSNKKKTDNKEKATMSQRFLTACLLILGGVIALYVAIELLSHFWGWIVLSAAVILVGWIAFKVIQARRDRW